MKSSREQFEEFARHRYGDDEVQLYLDEDTGEYLDQYENNLVQGEWESWEESRKAMISDLNLS